MADDEISLRREMARAAQAKILLDDEMLKEAFATLRQSYTDAWLNTDARDDDGRQRCWLAIKNLDKVLEHLDRVIRDGAVAARQLEFMEAQTKRQRRA